LSPGLAIRFVLTAALGVVRAPGQSSARRPEWTSCRCPPDGDWRIAAAPLLEVSSSIMARTRIELTRVSQTPLDG
jgi:hypothetical protein